MILKIIAFVAAAIPIFLFLRSFLRPTTLRPTTRISASLKEFKKQADLAVSIFLILVTCVVAFAVAKLAWTWWTSL